MFGSLGSKPTLHPPLHTLKPELSLSAALPSVSHTAESSGPRFQVATALPHQFSKLYGNAGLRTAAGHRSVFGRAPGFGRRHLAAAGLHELCCMVALSRLQWRDAHAMMRLETTVHSAQNHGDAQVNNGTSIVIVTVIRAVLTS